MPNLPFLNLDTTDIFVIDAAIPKSDYVTIDMSKHNEDLKNVDITSAKAMEDYITSFVDSKGGKVAIGGYMEVRDLYKRSEYFNDNANPNQERNIHLGVDVWINAGTKVLAALDGEVHSFKNNTNHGDYGPAIIVKHKLEEVTFYTLYGHLSLDSIANLKVGQQVSQGDVIGQLGDASVNGDYAPHLHLQVIMDMQDYLGDYPGVCCLDDLAFYQKNCPDGMNLLGIIAQ